MSIIDQGLLLNAASATSNPCYWNGGIGLFTVVGTFGGATVTLQYLADDGVTWVAVGALTTLTAAGNGICNLSRNTVRAAITGGSGVSVTASLRPVQEG